VIDPRRTQSAEQADLLLQPRPGSDAALALGIAHILVRDNLLDNSFIQKHVLGFEEFSELLDRWDPVRASETCGIPPDFIEKLGRMVGHAKPMTLIPGYGMQRYTNGGQTIRCLLALNILTGNIGKPGAGFGYANLQSYIFDSVKEPLSYYPPEVPDGIFRRSISMATLGRDMLEAKNPELKMIWVERGNPVCQNPDTNKVLEAFRKLDFRVVVEQFMTDTARQADIILPAKTMFEQSDIIGSYWNPYVQYRPVVVKPPGEVLPETAIYYRLAEKLGIPTGDLQGPDPVDDEKYLYDRVSEYPEIDWVRLKDGPLLPPGHEEIAYADLKFPTVSGKIELVSSSARTLWGVDELPGFTPLAEGESHHRSKHRYYLMTPNTKDRIHSQFGNLKMIKAVAGMPVAGMSPEDAGELGLKEGDLVRIFNDRGEIRIKIRPTPGMRPGCVTVFNGLWMEEGGTPNFLSLGRETDMGHGTAFHDNLVSIEKL
jgi:anaerobic selenocysteine-containing dehydrogenase